MMASYRMVYFRPDPARDVKFPAAAIVTYDGTTSVYLTDVPDNGPLGIAGRMSTFVSIQRRVKNGWPFLKTVGMGPYVSLSDTKVISDAHMQCFEKLMGSWYGGQETSKAAEK